MAVLEHDYRTEFDRLQAQGSSAIADDRIKDSLSWFQAAIEHAETHGDGDRADLAYCNLASVHCYLGDRDVTDKAMANRLREILMRNQDLTNTRLAAYCLSRIYELRKEGRKGLFYARIARDRSEMLERQDWIATSHNQLGNLLVSQSFFDEALTEYDEAIQLLHEDDVEHRAGIEINIGYCKLMQGDLGTAFHLLFKGLRTLRRLGILRNQESAHLDLCYAYLEAGRSRDALRHGQRGLSLAEHLGEVDAIKNALYLLGEASHLEGHTAEAHGYFQRLHDEFFPDSPIPPEFLLHVNVRQMINLRA